jgi:hypothetical protein
MRAFETDRLLRLLLRRAGGRLRYVVLERGDFDPRPRPWEADTERSVAWHTARQSAAAIAASWRLELPQGERVALIGSHAGQFLQRHLNYGAGPRLLRSLSRQGSADAAAWVASGGFRGLEEESARVHRQRRRRFLEHAASFRRTVADNSRRPRPRSAVTRASLAALVEQGRRVREAGPEPVLLIGPNDGRLRGVEVDTGGLLLLNFDDPVRFPELFAVELRYDSSHLTTAGAALYSRLLADELAARVGDGG